MMDNHNQKPTLKEIEDYIQNALFKKFCQTLETCERVRYQIDFSRCSLEYGWNVKIKKGSRTLCTIYPRVRYFRVMVVVSNKDQAKIDDFLLQASDITRRIYHETKEGNNQRWLMFDCEDENQVYRDVLRLIEIRKEGL